MADAFVGKDVISINELTGVANLLDAVNNLVVNWEGCDVEIKFIVLNVVDRQGKHVGAITKYDQSENVKFEPNFKAEL